MQNGFHMYTAINSVAAEEALKDVLDRPVYSVNISQGPDDPAVMYAPEGVLRPVSYWMTATPLSSVVSEC